MDLSQLLLIILHVRSSANLLNVEMVRMFFNSQNKTRMVKILFFKSNELNIFYYMYNIYNISVRDIEVQLYRYLYDADWVMLF